MTGARYESRTSYRAMIRAIWFTDLYVGAGLMLPKARLDRPAETHNVWVCRRIELHNGIYKEDTTTNGPS